MTSSKVRTGIALTCALLIGAGFEASAAMSSTGAAPKKVVAKPIPLCALGQKNTVAIKCTANPAFGKDACTDLVPAIQAIIGEAPTATANKAAISGIECLFIVGGKTQAFGVSMFGGTPKSTYQQSYQDDVSEAASLSCDNNGGTSFPPANAPQTVSGLGDEAYSWDQCTPHGNNDDTTVIALNGSDFYSVYSQHPYTEASVSQLVGLVRQLMAKYR